MPHLPFPELDPQRNDASALQTDRPLSVSQVNDLIKTVLGAAVPSPIRIVGEVSNLSQRTHWFFSLKDEDAAIRCVCFASNVRRIRTPVEDGMEVVATGRIDYWTAAGNVQLYVDDIEPVGQGALELRFRKLCDELRGLGYFDDERKKPLPMAPRRIAVVTSRSAAALQDVINTASRRWPGCQLLLRDVRVQGEAAAAQIARAIRQLGEQGARLGIEAIILTRGGGSIEDLWAFNEREVADALFHCAIPVVAAIGHETDTTVAELVADHRASTPTQAAMHLVPDRAALTHQVDQLAGRMTLHLQRALQYCRQRLDAAAKHPVFRRPRHMLDPQREKLLRLDQQLRALLPRTVEDAATRLKALQRQLQAVGPQNVLNRGYSYTLGPDGHVLRSAKEVAGGESMTTVLSDGKVNSTVDVDGSTSTSRSKKGRRTKQKQRPARPQGGTLFD